MLMYALLECYAGEIFQPPKSSEDAVHEITAGHLSLPGKISCVTDRIRFMLVTMTGRLSKFNSISYTEDRHELRVTGTKCWMPVTMSGTGEIFISGAERASLSSSSLNSILRIKLWHIPITHFMKNLLTKLRPIGTMTNSGDWSKRRESHTTKWYHRRSHAKNLTLPNLFSMIPAQMIMMTLVLQIVVMMM